MNIEDHIKFVNSETKDKRIDVTLHFENNDGYYDCEIHYDHIPVAYFNTTTGGITAIVFELHKYTDKNKPYWGDMTEEDEKTRKDIEYLQERGVIFDVEERHTIQYSIKFEQGFY